MIRLPVKRISSLNEMIQASPDQFYRYITRVIGKAVSEGKDDVELFKFGFTPATLGAPKSQWPELLTSAKDHFISIESYEEAAKVVKILDRMYINSI